MSRLPISRRWALRIAIAGAIAAFLIFRDRLPDINLERVVEELSEGLGNWTYLLVGMLAFLETGAFVGLVAPGEFTVMLGGAVAGQGVISLPLILAITWFAAWAGDSVSFLLGVKLGRGFVIRHGERVRITEERLRWVEDYLDRHGGKTIVVGRFIGLVRALAPFLAASGGMRYRVFVPYSILGTGLWAVAFILIGYFAAQSLSSVTEAVGTGLVVFGFVVGGIVAGIVLVRFLRVPANRGRVVAAIERRPYLRPVLRLGPQARFLWNRLTPGGLGLELTTVLSVLAVGLFVMISYWSVVAGDPGPTASDRAAADFASEIQSGWLTDLAKAVTALGSGWVVFPLAALCAGALALTRRWPELAVLAAGLAVTVVLTHEIKDWTDRTRPADGLVEAGGSAFPSAHASYATLYTAVAITLAVRVVPGLTRRGAVIGAGIAVTALVGLTRVYLDVHWLSDVSGGWALGASAFAAAAAVALIFVHIRDNHRVDGRDRDNADERGAAGGRL